MHRISTNDWNTFVKLIDFDVDLIETQFKLKSKDLAGQIKGNVSMRRVSI